MALCCGVPVGLVLTEDMVLLAQGTLVAGSLALLWPWFVEHPHPPSARTRALLGAIVVVGLGLALAWSSISWPLVMATQATVSIAVAGGLVLAVRSLPLTS